MQKVDSKSLFNKYVRESNILELFSNDMSNKMDLFYFKKGDILINEGECSDYLFFLVSGKMKVFSHSTSGKVMFVSHFKSLQILGETCSLWRKPPTASVQATTNGYCIGISLARYRDMLLNDIKFLRYTCMNLGERLSYMNNNTCITMFDSLESRLASFILRNSEDNVFHYNLTECAELLCTSYRHLLRVLNTLCNNGKLNKTGKYYKILDKDYFIEIASSSYDANY
jgi:CRP/FNR family transcriptional regulator, putaive post-exponential-phase nitrogen-starvation regulator